MVPKLDVEGHVDGCRAGVVVAETGQVGRGGERARKLRHLARARVERMSWLGDRGGREKRVDKTRALHLEVRCGVWYCCISNTRAAM